MGEALRAKVDPPEPVAMLSRRSKKEAPKPKTAAVRHALSAAPPLPCEAEIAAEGTARRQWKALRRRRKTRRAGHFFKKNKNDK